MKRVLLLSCLFISSFCLTAHAVEKLETNHFCVWIEERGLDRTHPQGLRYKMGMRAEIENSPDWYALDLGVVEGKPTSSLDFEIESLERKTDGDAIESLIVTLKHAWLPLESVVTYSAYGTTGVITRSVKMKNRSTRYPLHLTQVPSLEIGLPKGDYDYMNLTSGWANERKWLSRPVTADTVYMESTSGRSSTDYSPWLGLHDKERDIYYNAQLAWSGNWYMKIAGGDGLSAAMGEYFDNNQLLLLPGREVLLPEVAMSGGYHSIDVAANNLHRYQRRYLLKVPETNDPMLVQFNTWFPLQIHISADSLKPYIDEAADLGLEVFTIDAGWFVHDSYEREVGNWDTNLKKFPAQLSQTANYIRSKGMKFGLWFEIESLGEGAELLRQHPDWCLQAEGEAAICPPWSNRRHLDFSKPEVFDWALQQFDKMYAECQGIDWVKLDYNVSIGSQFRNEAGVATGDCLRNHILAFYTWLDVLSEKYPNLVLENCSSGALRMDIGMLKHTHTSFVSDETSVNPSLAMAWSSTLEYTPRMINHWTVGMKNHVPVIDESLPRSYWDYMFRVPMNGQFGVSSRILEWSPALKACAKENIALYKTIREVIADADCFHLTPQPDYTDPQGWTVLAYVTEDADRAVVMANRGKGKEASFTLRVPKLKTSANYVITIDGKTAKTRTGVDLMKEGMTLQLGNYCASVISFQEK